MTCLGREWDERSEEGMWVRWDWEEREWEGRWSMPSPTHGLLAAMSRSPKVAASSGLLETARSTSRCLRIRAPCVTIKFTFESTISEDTAMPARLSCSHEGVNGARWTGTSFSLFAGGRKGVTGL